MKVTELQINGRDRYSDYTEPFHGVVKLEAPSGKQEVTLTPSSIAAIFAVVKEQVANTAKANAKLVSQAVQSAADSPLLLEQSSMGELE